MRSQPAAFDATPYAAVSWSLVETLTIQLTANGLAANAVRITIQ